MTKKIFLLSVLTLVGCGTNSTPELPPQATLKNHSITYNNHTWNLSIPSTWEMLPLEEQVLFMARNGDENFVILERGQTAPSPAQQILKPARAQFVDFTLEAETQTEWRFTGKINATTPKRTFWQKAEPLPEEKIFLLGSCSHHSNNLDTSFCEAILDSWQKVTPQK